MSSTFRSRNNLFQHLATTTVFLILLTHTAHAILDTNSNTLSDLWEKQFNNQQLFPTTAGQLPDDDPDGDGWTNIREAAAGTNPFEANPPDGIVRPAILHFPATSSVDPNDGTVLSTPGAFSLTWPTFTGKQYTLSASIDLTSESWIAIGPPFIAAGGTTTTTVPVTQPDGSVPEKLFWRVAVNDVDTDGDNLTNSEEHLLGTNPAATDSDFDGLSDHAEMLAGLNPKHPDFDLDGILDGSDATPFANNAIANPDGENLPVSLTTKITGRWDLETINISNGIRTTPNATTPFTPATLGGGIAADSSGMVSKATRMSGMNQYLRTDPSTIAGKTSFSISLWFRLEKNYLQNKPGSLNTVLFAYNDVLDSTPLFQLHACKAISTMAPQKLVFSHYSNTALQPDMIADIPLSAPLDDGQWQHLTLTKQSGIICIYRNAQQVISGGGHSGTWATGTNAYLCFGALAPANSIADTNFRGSMDRIHTWSSALSQTEVTSLYRQDIDRDGLWDITESGTRYSDYQSALPYHPAPNDPNAPQPTQTGYARSPYLHSSSMLDFDQDDLNDLAEQVTGTRLTEPDTDQDDLTDGFEVAHQFNPLNAFSLGLNGPRDDLSDPDSDSLTTLTEYFNGSNPRTSNTDGDATNDTTEVAQGSDPANAADSGAAPTDPPYQVPFHINGDYTAWEATLKGKGPNDTRTRRFRMSGHNIPLDETFELLRGNAYELTLRYIRSKPGESVPWYCWEASINGDTSPIFIAGGEWIVDNRSGLLAEHTHSHGTNRIADRKVDFKPIQVKEVWSDQISGVEANGFPDKTGQKQYPYILIGANSGSTFRIKIKLASEIPAAFQPKILFRWSVTADSVSPENGTSTFTDAKTVILDSNAGIGSGPRGLLMGDDRNSNAQLEASEITAILYTPHIQSGTSTTVPYKFIPISQTRYNDSKSELLGWTVDAPSLGLTEGARHLTAFCNGTIPEFAGSAPTTIKRNEPGLSHPVGSAFIPVSNPGESFKAIISKDHDLSINLVESNALRSWMTGEFNLVADAIRADIIEAQQNGNPAQLLSYSMPATEKSLGFGLSDPDLLVSLGRITLQDPVIQFKVTMNGYVNDVKIFGTASDLYDFDYGGEELLGFPARKASEVQAGFPSLGTGGKIFKTSIDLGGGNPYANPDLIPYTFFPN